jgi:hypothetical protein
MASSTTTQGIIHTLLDHIRTLLVVQGHLPIVAHLILLATTLVVIPTVLLPLM